MPDLPSVPLQFNETKRVENPLNLTNEVIDQIVGFLPEGDVGVQNPLGFGPDITFNPRDKARGILAGAVQPVAKTQYSTSGNCDNVDAITIVHDGTEVVNAHGGQFKVFGFGISINFRATVLPAEGIGMVRTNDCPGEPGKRRERVFTVRWFVDISINPGPILTYEAVAQNQLVHTPCCKEGVGVVPPPKPPPDPPPGVDPPGDDSGLECGDARYVQRQVTRADGERVTKHFICVQVTNCGPDDVTICADLSFLDTGLDQNDPDRYVPSPWQDPAGQREVTIPGRVVGEFGESKGSVDICFELSRAPTPGQLYEVILGTAKDEDGELNRGDVRNDLKRVTIPRKVAVRPAGRFGFKFDVGKNLERPGFLALRSLMDVPEDWKFRIGAEDAVRERGFFPGLADVSVLIPPGVEAGQTAQVTLEVYPLDSPDRVRQAISFLLEVQEEEAKGRKQRKKDA